MAFMYGDATPQRTIELGKAFNTIVLHSAEKTCREQLIEKVEKCFNVFVAVMSNDIYWQESLALTIPHAKIYGFDLKTQTDEVIKWLLSKFIATATTPCVFTSYALENRGFNYTMRTLMKAIEYGAPPGEEFDEIQHHIPMSELPPNYTPIPFKNLDVTCPDFIASMTPQRYNNPYDFWKKVWDHSSVMVQLNSEFDYLSEAVQHVGEFVICPGEKVKLKEGAVIETKITMQTTEETKEVTHYLIDHWIDGEAYPNPTVIDFVIDKVKFFADLDFQMAPLVHCTAGVGRTGTFLAAYLKRHLLVHQKLWVDKELFARDATSYLRLHRPGAVFTPVQFIFLHEYDPK